MEKEDIKVGLLFKIYGHPGRAFIVKEVHEHNLLVYEILDKKLGSEFNWSQFGSMTPIVKKKLKIKLS